MVFFRFFMNTISLRGRVALLAISLVSIPNWQVVAADRPSRSDLPASLLRPESQVEDYILQPQDVLRIFVFQHDDLNKQCEAVSISKEYTISLPLIKTVNLSGKTVRQAEELIRVAYDKDYLVNPQVSVMVVKYSERSVNVGGAVNTAGRILFPQERGLTIVDAISLAGGPSRIADLKRVKLTRKNAAGETVTEEVNVDSMWKGGGRDALILQKDDNIFVPERIL